MKRRVSEPILYPTDLQNEAAISFLKTHLGSRVMERKGRSWPSLLKSHNVVSVPELFSFMKNETEIAKRAFSQRGFDTLLHKLTCSGVEASVPKPIVVSEMESPQIGQAGLPSKFHLRKSPVRKTLRPKIIKTYQKKKVRIMPIDLEVSDPFQPPEEIEVVFEEDDDENDLDYEMESDIENPKESEEFVMVDVVPIRRKLGDSPPRKKKRKKKKSKKKSSKRSSKKTVKQLIIGFFLKKKKLKEGFTSEDIVKYIRLKKGVNCHVQSVRRILRQLTQQKTLAVNEKEWNEHRKEQKKYMIPRKKKGSDKFSRKKVKALKKMKKGKSSRYKVKLLHMVAAFFLKKDGTADSKLVAKWIKKRFEVTVERDRVYRALAHLATCKKGISKEGGGSFSLFNRSVLKMYVGKLPRKKKKKGKRKREVDDTLEKDSKDDFRKKKRKKTKK